MVVFRRHFEKGDVQIDNDVRKTLILVKLQRLWLSKTGRKNKQKKLLESRK
jgi:hypothetical protein